MNTYADMNMDTTIICFSKSTERKIIKLTKVLNALNE